MTEPELGNPGTDADARMDGDLTAALRTGPLGPEALARIQAAVRLEWNDVRKSRRRSLMHRWLMGAAAASIVAVALLLGWNRHSPAERTLFGSISRIEKGGAEVESGRIGPQPLQAGDLLRSADQVAIHGVALIALPSGGNLRVSPGSVIVVLGVSDIRLQRGMIYVDEPPAADKSNPLRIRTRAGTIEHAGTEFEVFNNEQLVRVRVREGQVRLRNSSHDLLAPAGTELLVTPDGSISRHDFPTHGSEWHWVAESAPNYEIEGHPLLDFLEFESRELGYELVFADAHAREVAQLTILHGNVHGREPLDAVASVLATTSLSYSIRGNALRVQSSDGT